MKRSMHWSSGLVLCGALALAACGGDKAGDTGGSATATSSAKPEAKADATTSGTAKVATAGSTKPADGGTADGPLGGDDDGPEEGLIPVGSLAEAKNDAPALGGTAPPTPPPPPKGADIEWLTAGPLSIPNPGWTLEKHGHLGVLMSPDKKGGLLFTGFTDPKDGLQKVDDITAALHLKDMKWHKPKAVTLGPDKVPALFGTGKAKDKDGKGNHLFYLLVKNTPENLLAIGGADDDGGEGALKTALRIMDNIKKGK